MTSIRVVFSFLVAAALVACGRGGTVDDFRDAAPTFEKLALSQNDGDLADSSDLTSSDALAAPECHPHLFVRTHEIIRRVNRHFRKHLHHVEELIEDDPLNDGETKIWENVRAGIDRRFTMTRTANLDGSVTYDFTLEVAAVPASGPLSFVKVMSGSITVIGGSGAVDAGAQRIEHKGTVTFDFTALASVRTKERARGQITDRFENVRDPVLGVKRSAAIELTSFTPEEGDRHGPRTGSYTWVREPGVGGKFQFQDTVVLFCLRNPAGEQSELTAAARWYKASDGAVHGRTDAMATGGQLADGEKWVGVTCAKGPTTSTPAEGFWMIKLEDAAGATEDVRFAQVGVEPCDPVFGPVPSATDSGTDFNFGIAVTFPGEW